MGFGINHAAQNSTARFTALCRKRQLDGAYGYFYALVDLIIKLAATYIGLSLGQKSCFKPNVFDIGAD